MTRKVALFAGHSRLGGAHQVEEHGQVWPAYEIASHLLRRAGVTLVHGEGQLGQTGSVYDRSNDDALKAKVNIANEAKVDLACEMHLNRPMIDKPYGVSIYFETHDRNDWSEPGLDLAGAIQWAATPLFGYKQKEAMGQYQLSGKSFWFLAQTNCPAVLTEIGFVGQNIDSVRHGMAVAGGILRYLEDH